jgi:hypothetical protein
VTLPWLAITSAVVQKAARPMKRLRYMAMLRLE